MRDVRDVMSPDAGGLIKIDCYRGLMGIILPGLLGIILYSMINI